MVGSGKPSASHAKVTDWLRLAVAFIVLCLARTEGGTGREGNHAEVSKGMQKMWARKSPGRLTVNFYNTDRCHEWFKPLNCQLACFYQQVWCVSSPISLGKEKQGWRDARKLGTMDKNTCESQTDQYLTKSLSLSFLLVWRFPVNSW